MLKSTIPVLSYALFLFCAGSAAQAKIGEPIQTYKTKVAPQFKFKQEVKADPNMYYMFSLITQDKETQMDPGFAAGATITVKDGKIQGQSMAFRLGQNTENGKLLAVAHCLDFVYEAIGKPEPKSHDDQQKEFKNYGLAVGMVFSGQPQSVHYPGFNAKITLSKSDNGDLLVAITPEEPSPTTAVNPPATNAAAAPVKKGK